MIGNCDVPRILDPRDGVVDVDNSVCLRLASWLATVAAEASKVVAESSLSDAAPAHGASQANLDLERAS